MNSITIDLFFILTNLFSVVVAFVSPRTFYRGFWAGASTILILWLIKNIMDRK